MNWSQDKRTNTPNRFPRRAFLGNSNTIRIGTSVSRIVLQTMYK